MKHTVSTICSRIIEYGFYAIFLLVPLAFTSTTSELFEFNKMWLTFGITLLIAAAWFSKMIVERKIFIQKTPLDIPLALFLLAHCIATLFSIDQHISLWGYYSRFNGGLYSIMAYIFLYYAFVTNFVTNTTIVKRSLLISLLSGIIVALWGLPSHFGYDPTCLLFRGTLDVSCWTESFQPKIRIFSTLGQPNWLAAYLSILLPLALAYGLQYLQKAIHHTKKQLLLASGYFLIAALFYIDIIYTASQSGFVGAVVAIGIFLLGFLFLHRRNLHKKTLWYPVGALGASCLLIAFVIGQPIPQLNRFTLSELQKTFTQQAATKTQTPAAQAGTALEGGGGGGTSSGTIRKNVWQGAIDTWKANPLFGTGVETFAFAYYGYRPAAHNMTSEWDYLYNKAHNEYLNYLATTGIAGLGSYLFLIGLFLWVAGKSILKEKSEHDTASLTLLALLAGYVSILVSNFFGFSVVIVNLYLFLIPAFLFILTNKLAAGKAVLPSFIQKSSETPSTKQDQDISSMQWVGIVVISGLAIFQIFTLVKFWYADQAFALAQNLNRIGQYNEGYKKIREAIDLRNEPVFREELATNDATIAVALASQKQEDTAKQLAAESIQLSNQLVAEYPHNINFLKSQVRIYYTLSQLNPAYLKDALETMKRIAVLAPTDAKVAYNLGVLYGQTGETQKGIDVLKQTIKLKSDYRDAYFALGLFYRDLAVDPKTNRVINAEMQQKAEETMRDILTRFGKKDQAVLDTLKSWGATP